MSVDATDVMSFDEWKSTAPAHAAKLAEEATLAERARILKIQELAANFAEMDAQAADEVKAGHSPDVAAAAFSQIYGARRRQGLDDMESEAPKDLAATEPAPVAAASTLSPEEQLKAKWDGDEALRAEFGGDFETYKAFAAAEESGAARILTR